jgi:S1-C subfamily serine protease
LCSWKNIGIIIGIEIHIPNNKIRTKSALEWGAIADSIVITDTRLNPGYSGGRLVHVEGKMIGLNAAYVSSRRIAIRAAKVGDIAYQLAKDGAVNKTYLEIVANQVSRSNEVSAQLDPRQEQGLILLSV